MHLRRISRQQIASLQPELIDRWPPSIAYHNSWLGRGFVTNQGHFPWSLYRSSHHSLVCTLAQPTPWHWFLAQIHFLTMSCDK